MDCSRCGLRLSLDDNFCRRCGTAAEIVDVPVVRSEVRPLTVWQQARPAVARGVALVAAGAMLRVVVGWAGRAVMARTLSDDPGPLRRMIPFKTDRASARDDDELEILWYRRTRR